MKKSMKLNEYDIIIVGGGAAGLFAAATAASANNKVLLVEKNKRLGLKLSITGKGRCNVTNNCTKTEVLHNIPHNYRFLYSSIELFGPEDIITFFEANGVPLQTERGNRVFPISGKAADVVSALTNVIHKLGVTVIQATITELVVANNTVVGVSSGTQRWFAPKVILATGGASYPKTGSTGDGFRLSEKIGHTITPISGSLVPIELEGNECTILDGLELKNVGLKLIGTKKKPIYEDFGEATFLHYGLSGPIALSCSAHIPDDTTSISLELDLKPALNLEQLEKRVLKDFTARSNETIYSCLRGLLPSKLIEVILPRCSINPKRIVFSITKEERMLILEQVKHFRFKVIGKRPVEEAIITRGGIKISEINPRTMESKVLPGLFFAGEIIDCDAYTGGFNLQIAWSTAYSAAQNN